MATIANKKNDAKAQEQLETEQRKRLIELIEEFYKANQNKTIVSDEVFLEFIDALVNKNPFVKELPGVSKLDVIAGNIKTSVEDLGLSKTGANVAGEANAYFGTIKFSSILKTSFLWEILRVAGHEESHLNQKEKLKQIQAEKRKEKSDNRKKLENDLQGDNDSSYWDQSTVKLLIKLLGSRLMKFEEYRQLSPAEKTRVCNDIASCQYHSLLSERLAQLQGYSYAEHILNEVINDELTDPEVSIWLISQLNNLRKVRETDPYLKNNPGSVNDISYSAIRNGLRELKAEEVLAMFSEIQDKSAKLSSEMEWESEKQILEQGNSVALSLDSEISPKHSELSQRLLQLNMNKLKIIEFYTKEADPNSLANLIGLGIGELDQEVLSELVQGYKGRVDVSKGDSKQLDVTISDVLSVADLPVQAYETNYVDFVDNDMLYQTIIGLFEAGQIFKAGKLFSSSCPHKINKLKINMLVSKFEDARKQFAERIKAGEKVSKRDYDALKLDDYNRGEIYDMRLSEKINFMSNEEEIEYFQENGCESLIPYVEFQHKSEEALIEEQDKKGIEKQEMSQE